MAKKADNKKSKERASKYEDTRLYINGSLDGVLMATFPKIVKGMWHFKSGEALPKIEPKNYLLLSIDCLIGTIDDFEIKIRYKEGDDSKYINMLFVTANNYACNQKRTKATFRYPINLSGKEIVLIEINPLKIQKEYDFNIVYETL